MSFYSDLRKELLKLNWSEVEANVYFKNGCWFLADTRSTVKSKYASIVNIKRASWQVEYGHYVLNFGKADKYMTNYDSYPAETQANVVKNFVYGINRLSELPLKDRTKGCKTLPIYTNGFRVLDQTPLEKHTSHFCINGEPGFYQYAITPDTGMVELVDGKNLEPFCTIEQFVELCEQRRILSAIGADDISSGSLDVAKIQENGITNRIADLCNTVQEWYDLHDLVDNAKNPTLYLKNSSLRPQLHRLLYVTDIITTPELIQSNLSESLINLIKVSEQFDAPYLQLLNSNLPDVVINNMVSTVQSRMMSKTIELQRAGFNTKIIPALLKVDNPERFKDCQYPSQVKLLQDDPLVQRIFEGAMPDRVLHAMTGSYTQQILEYFYVDLDNIYAKALNDYISVYLNDSRTLVYHEQFGLGIEYGKSTIYRDINSIYLVRNEDEKVTYRYTFVNGDCIFGGSYCPILLQV